MCLDFLICRKFVDVLLFCYHTWLRIKLDFPNSVMSLKVHYVTYTKIVIGKILTMDHALIALSESRVKTGNDPVVINQKKNSINMSIELLTIWLP